MSRLSLSLSLSLSFSLSSCGAPDATIRAITITSDVFDDPGPGARLSDGAVLAAGMGDLYLAQRSTVSVFAWAPIGICDLGVVPSFAETPTDPGACLGAPMDSLVLGGNADGQDAWVGRAGLVFPDPSFDHAPTYRARIVSDSVSNPHVTMTFELEALR